MHKYHIAALFTAFRFVAALALIPLVLNGMYDTFVSVLILAALSDSLDGSYAHDYPAPKGHWARRHGKRMNDTASGVLSWTAPGSILLWVFLNHPGSGWFWSWVGGAVVFVLGTLWFNHHKGAQYDIDHRVRAEVAQGWFFGLLLLACGVQVAYLIPGMDSGDWWFFGLLTLCAVIGAKHRWTDRPEVRREYARTLASVS